MRFIHAADIHLDSPLVGLDSYAGAPISVNQEGRQKKWGNRAQVLAC